MRCAPFFTSLDSTIFPMSLNRVFSSEVELVVYSEIQSMTIVNIVGLGVICSPCPVTKTMALLAMYSRCEKHPDLLYLYNN